MKVGKRDVKKRISKMMIDDVIIFDPDKPIKCPACGESRKDYISFWIAADGNWYFDCFECNASWVRKEKNLERIGVKNNGNRNKKYM